VSVIASIGPFDVASWQGSLQAPTDLGSRPSRITTSAFADSFDAAWLIASAYAQLVGPTSDVRVIAPSGAVYDGVAVGGLLVLSVHKVQHRLGSHQVDAEWELYL
jgi:hypothetical protein